ncbi:hypothetical protein LWI28_003096 [Acer negundo]|uniref:CLASP N-terminal domain-containing protein n=1 Tax=Acer negundo TaxID=4023 RepID=A0AAD5NVL8_ACENE|nr:hypothetical protein LWI28_003096 [Acer negundo]
MFRLRMAVKEKKVQRFSSNQRNISPHPRLREPPLNLPTIRPRTTPQIPTLPNPESKFQSLIEGLDSKDWTKVCESLNDARRFALYHSSLLVPLLEKVTVVVVKSMKNPRSALCKTSIMASSDIFKAFGDQLLGSNSDALDSLLLLKASQDKKLVCEEADKT